MDTSDYRDSREYRRGDRSILSRNSGFFAEDPVYQYDQGDRIRTRNFNPSFGNRDRQAYYRDEPPKHNRKKFCLFWSLVFLVITGVILTIGLATFLVLYFTGLSNLTVGSTSSPLTDGSVTTTTPAVSGTPPLSGPVTLDTDLTIQGTFKDAYNDPSSPEYQALARMVLATMNDAYKSSDVGTVYDRTEVVEFRNGSIIAVLRSVFRRALRGSGVSSSDLNSILSDFVSQVRETINMFIERPGCCNSLVLRGFRVVRAVIDPPSANGVPTNPPVIPPTEPATDPPTDPPTVVPTVPPTDPLTNPPTDPPTTVPTAPPTDPPTDPTTRAPTVPPTDPPTDPPTVPPTDPPTDPPTSAPTVPPTDPATTPPTDSSTDPPTEATTDLSTLAPIDPNCGSTTETAPVKIVIAAGKAEKISSPNYPCAYPDCTNLTWIVETTADQKLRMTFTSFNIDGSQELFSIGDGEDINNQSTLFFAWSAPSVSPDLISDGNTAWITFRSTANVTDGFRFRLVVTSVPSTDSITCSCDEFDCGHSVCIDAKLQCNVNYDCVNKLDEYDCDACNTSSYIAADFNTTVSIDSTTPPGYFQISPSYTDCYWRVTAPPNAHIIFRFYRYDVRSGFIIGTGDGTDQKRQIVYLFSGQADHVQLVFELDNIWIQTNFHSASEFQFGVRAVLTEDYTSCGVYPHAYLKEQTCDGMLECPNGEDEAGCDCQAGDYRCGDGVCVSPADAECNHQRDCLDHSDEGPQCINTTYCLDIQDAHCTELLPYRQTYFPNDIVPNQRQASDLIAENLGQMLSNCSDAQQVVLCRSIYPACPRFTSDQVCSSACKDALECAGLTGNSSLQCDVYPNQNSSSGEDNSCGFSEDDVLKTGDCGTRPAASPDLNPFSRIVGGNDTHIANWPWIASFRYSRGGRHGCGATLITPQWAVTAAHCTIIGHLVFGSSILDVPNSYPHMRTVVKFIKHPLYNSVLDNHDIALLKLDSPVELSDTIRPACLATEENELEIYDTCHAVGWGLTEFRGTELPPVLKETLLPLVSHDNCLQRLNATGNRGSLFVSHKQICAGLEGERKSPCQGDSGGPLICRGANGRWKLVGITSIGLSCGGQGTGAVFTRVSQYIDFIRFTIASDSRPTHFLNVGADEKRVITSPSYPDNYPNYLDITWSIKTDKGRKILINVSSFNTQSGFDFFTAGDGLELADNIFLKWSGAVSQQSTILSAGNIMWLRFTSDKTYTAPGFSLTVASIPSNESKACTSEEFDCGHLVCINRTLKCDGEKDCFDGRDEVKCTVPQHIFINPTAEQIITSPGFPSPYPSDNITIWIVTTSENRRLLIVFDDVSLELNDVLLIGEGADFEDEATLVYSWRGDSSPTPLMSDGITVWITFSSDTNPSNNTGFRLRVTSVPFGGCISNPCLNNGECHLVNSQSAAYFCVCQPGFSGLTCNVDDAIYIGQDSYNISSPGYPLDDYPLDIDITWRLRTDANKRIRVNCSFFETEKDYDFVGAGDGYDDRDPATEFFSWSGSRLPPSLLSDGNTMWIRFTSDSGVAAAGFSCVARAVQYEGNLTCLEGQFDCGHSVCITEKWVCDSTTDCLDERDEPDRCGCLVNKCPGNSTCRPFNAIGFDCECHSRDAYGSSCEKVLQRIFINVDESKEITSPDYPFLDLTDTTWVVNTTNDRKLRITFSNFSTVQGEDFIYVGDGDVFSNGSSRFFQWSGTNRAPQLISSGNTVWITFSSTSGAASNLGFSLNIISVPSTDSITCSEDEFDCGHSVCIESQLKCDRHDDCSNGYDERDCDACNTTSYVTLDFDTSISIFSSSSSDGHGRNCKWTVKAPLNASILIHMYRFDIPRSSVVVISAEERVDLFDRSTWLAYFQQGHQDPGYIVFETQTIGIYFSGPPSDAGFHFGIEAVHSGKGYTNCKVYPYVHLNEERCDGILQCPNGDDEVGCDCQVGRHLCANGISVSNPDAECDGNVDCIDYSDEGISCHASYCVDIENTVCREILPYKTTLFSNDLGLSQQQANDLIMEHLPRIMSNCSEAQQVALCRSIYPACPRFTSDQVCSSACKDALECAGLTGNTSLQCDVYPDQMSCEADICGFIEEDVIKTAAGASIRPAAPPRPRRVKRIVGGRETQITSWPWIASWRFKDGKHGCGATLISPLWAVTAAHCSADLDHLVFGSSYLNVSTSYPHIRRIAKAYKHPAYSSSTYNNDILLLKLESPVELSDAIQPAWLATEDNEAEIFQTCYALGWGSTSNGGSYSQVLKEVRLPIHPLEKCQNNSKIRGSIILSSNQICADDEVHGNSTCKGDSGGPLVCLSENERWKLVGITSLGLKCGEPGSPSIFARVSKYIDFIRYTIASDGYPQHSIYLAAGNSTTITSPSHPDSYPINLDVSWVIKTDEDRKIQILFSSFDTQRGGEFFRAGDGVDFTSKGFFEWSGIKSPPKLLSSGNRLWLSFSSDEFISHPWNGFSLTAVSVPQTETLNCSSDQFDCGHSVCITTRCDYVPDCLDGVDELACERGPIRHFIPANDTLDIFSPAYPERYPNDLDIVWILSTESNRKISIMFSSFSTEKGYDELHAGNGSYPLNQFFLHSGSIIPPDVLSTSSVMWLRFTSDSSFSTQGFSLTAVSVPSPPGIG